VAQLRAPAARRWLPLAGRMLAREVEPTDGRGRSRLAAALRLAAGLLQGEPALARLVGGRAVMVQLAGSRRRRKAGGGVKRAAVLLLHQGR
jgi:hypothetical protein